MAEENQIQQVTAKDPKKVEAGKRLVEYNRRKREELKAQKSESKQVEPVLTSSQCYGIGAVLAGGGDRQSWLLRLPSQERRSQCRQQCCTFSATS